MVLYVVPVPAPAAGQDWLATVPGQYIYDITAITATLATGGPLNFMADSSGNGNDGAYSPVGAYPKTVAGIISGDAAKQFADPTMAMNSAGAGSSHPAIDWSGPLTIEFYATLSTNSFDGHMVAVTPYHGLTPQWHMDISAGLNVLVERFDGSLTDDWQWDSPGLPNDGLPHRWCLTWDGVNMELRIDTGFVVPFNASIQGANLSAGTGFTMVGNDGFNNGVNCTLDEFAIYNYALDPTQDTAHYNAGLAGFASYRAAVLGDGPAVYYHLDDGPSTGRQVVLDVTDGTHLIEEIPTGFADTTHAGPYSYTWQPNLNSSTQTPDGTITTIAVPQLILPAGYTVGTRTLDLTGTDQWSNINVWWSSDVMDALAFRENYQYPPGVRLVYKKAGVP